ncbi:MAG: hypothetical protein DWI21_07480 [Planctomycetota bacterium]|nr:MAG: hypothetical protein DWI21_07480 [Planctomycetota bacterium]
MRGHQSQIHGRSAFVILSVILLAGHSANARPPEIRNVNVRGFQIGQPTVVTIDGVDLLPAPKLWLNASAVDAAIDDKQSNANRLVLTATLPNEITPGVAQLRLATNEGVSNSVTVALDRLPQLPISETIAALPASLHGSVPGSGVSKTSFTGKAGEDVLIEVEAKRLGSKLRPVVHLLDAQRVQVAWAMPSRTLAGDCRIATKLPRDGQYTIEIHDLQYAPPGVSFFRLKVGQWQFADLAFPPAVTRGQEVALELLGASGGAKLPFKAPMDGDVIPTAFPNPQAASGSPPGVLLSSLIELVEFNVATGGSPVASQASSTGEPPVPSIPVAISGRLDAPGQLDQYRFAVTVGAKLTFEVFAERFGSRVDAVLELRNKDGGVLASNDDGPISIDPRLEFTVPAGLDTLVVVLRDALEIANEQAIYRLVVTNADKPTPEVTVTAKSDVANIASGESQVFEVNVSRRGYDGPLQLSLGQLPPGVTATGNEIPAGASGTLLTLTGVGDAASQLVTSLMLKSPDGTVSSRVRTDVPADDRTPVWLREQFAIAATPKSPTPFQIAWADAQPMTQLALMSKPAIPVKFIRPPGMLGPIRLTFVTSQLEPRVNNQPNLILALRPERVVEVPVDPPVQAAITALNTLITQLAEAVKQAAVAQGDAKIAADAKVADLTTKKTAAEAAVREAEAKAPSTSELSLVIPSVLPESSCDVAIKAELLNPERNVVLRTTYSPVRRLPVLNPLAAKLSGPTTIEQTLDPKAGAVVKLTGKIERLAGFKGDVNLTLTGQPGGVAITNAAVKADQTDFALELRFPANFVAGEVKGIKLIATGPPDPLTGNQPIRTEVELIVKLVATPAN